MLVWVTKPAEQAPPPSLEEGVPPPPEEAPPPSSNNTARQRGTAVATWVLGALLTVVFVGQTIYAGGHVMEFSVCQRTQLQARFTPLTVRKGQVWRLLTSLWVHGSIFHFLSNIFSAVPLAWLHEKAHGGAYMVAVFLGCGLTGNLLSSVGMPGPFQIPCLSPFFCFDMCVGVADMAACGASAGVMGLFGTLIVTIIRTKPPKVVAVLLLVALTCPLQDILLDIIFKMHIDYLSHVGGFCMGVAAELLPSGRAVALAVAVTDTVLMAILFTVTKGSTDGKRYVMPGCNWTDF
jgi:membrane associated rhomboid family serine protease